VAVGAGLGMSISEKSDWECLRLSLLSRYTASDTESSCNEALELTLANQMWPEYWHLMCSGFGSCSAPHPARGCGVRVERLPRVHELPFASSY